MADIATEEMATADATAIVTIFTVHLRCLGQDECLADAACDAKLVRAQATNASQNPGIRSRKCHGRSGARKNLLAINHSSGAFRRNAGLHAAALFPHVKLAMRKTSASGSSSPIFYSFE
jgi:hypothetical protein